MRRVALTAAGREVIERARQERADFERQLRETAGSDAVAAARTVLDAATVILGIDGDITDRKARPPHGNL